MLYYADYFGKQCTIVLPNIKNYQWDYVIALIFSEKKWMKNDGLEYVRAYIDDQLIISNGNYKDHLNKYEIVSKEAKAAGFKINEKNRFLRDSFEHLGFKITRQDTMPYLIKYKQSKT